MLHHQRKIHNQISLTPLPHIKTIVIHKIDQELEHFQTLSNKRREKEPLKQNVNIRKIPIPNILQKEYCSKSVLRYANDGKNIELPYPSILNPIKTTKSAHCPRMNIR
jgi:hypothetical protein